MTIVLRVGHYNLDEGLAQLIDREGNRQNLTPILFKLLTYLIHNNQRLVSKNELMLRVWGHSVSNSAIDKSITQLRQHFGDNAQRSDYVENRRGLGYRIVAPITELTPTPLDAPFSHNHHPANFPLDKP
ncbi:MAG: hypothetical protein Alis3KO_05660 [Aliiglaciecola sp.]